MRNDDTLYAAAPTGSAAANIDLMPYINALIDARWWLLAATLACGLATGLWASNKPYVYQSGAKVSVVDIEDPGGVSPDDRRASEVLTLVEHGFIMGSTRDNYDEVMLARLRSRDFSMRFIEQHNLYRFFHPQQWDADNGSWRDGFTPDRGAAFTRLRDEVRRIEHDELTDIITVSMQWPDPALARDWANSYVSAFNEFIREKTLDEVARKLEFLDRQLRSSDVLEIQQSIYRLIEAQTAIAMLANSRVEYALEIIDPAAMAYKSFNMPRKTRAVLGAFAGLLLATFSVLGYVLLEGMLATLKQHRQHYLNARQDSQVRATTNQGDL